MHFNTSSFLALLVVIALYGAYHFGRETHISSPRPVDNNVVIPAQPDRGDV